MDFLARFFRIPGRSCFLFGPRGTGKSTLLRERLPDALHLDLLDPALHRSLSARPERLRELLAGAPDVGTVVIDEIQRVPELLTVVHAVMEEPARRRFAQGGRRLPGHSGGLATGHSGCRSFEDVPSGRLWCMRSSIYSTRSVLRSLRPRGPLDAPEEIAGQALEGLVAQHLRAWAAYSQHDAEVFYWRTQGGTEVDFVVYRESGIQAFEVKNAARVYRRDLRPLKAFRDDYPEAEAAVLYRGRDRLEIDGIRCLPVADFLRGVVPDQGLFEAV